MGFFKEIGSIIHDTARIIEAVQQPEETTKVIVIETPRKNRHIGTVKIDWTEKIHLVGEGKGEIFFDINNGKVKYKTFGFFKREGVLITPFIGPRTENCSFSVPKINGNLRVNLSDENYIDIVVD